MVEATTGFRLDPTFRLDVYKVFWHHDLLCMGICVHPYSVRHVQVEVDFGVLGVDLSLNDVVMSRSRLQQASDWILHPY